jgi:hypothetical protein
MAQSCRFERSRSKTPACPCTSAEKAVRLAAISFAFSILAPTFAILAALLR